LKRININALVVPAFSVRSGIARSDILKSYLGQLCLGKNDFNAIEGQRNEAYFIRALGLRAVSSSPTLRKRMDTHVPWVDLDDHINAAVLGLEIGGKPVDFGVLPMAIRLTASHGGDGGGNIAVPLLFRAATGFDTANLMCVIGQHAQTQVREVAFIIKWNPLATPVETVCKDKVADASTTWTQLREGKRQWVVGLGANDTAFVVFERLWAELDSA